jgi:hypothetical protein
MQADAEAVEWIAAVDSELKLFLESKAQEVDGRRFYSQYKEFFIFDRGLATRSNTVFDHKVADYLSVMPFYDNGKVYEVGGQYKVVEEMMPDGAIVDKVVRVPFFGALRPVYKTK